MPYSLDWEPANRSDGAVRAKTKEFEMIVEGITDLRILAVEDNFEAMNMLRCMLNDLHVNQVYTAKDGKEALDFMGMCDGLIDIVLCDWNMPKLSGIELLKQIRTVDPDMPFIMITGTTDAMSVVEAKVSGVTGYIKKPFSQDELGKKLGIVVRLIQHRESAA